MSHSQRDSQRKRLYDAERSVYTMEQTIPNDMLQIFVDEVMDKRAILSRWGRRHLVVRLARGGGRVWDGLPYIDLGVVARCEWVILHEIAHQLTPETYADHGPEFAGIYLFLVKTVLGPTEATRLREAMRVHKVRISNRALPEASSHSVTEIRERQQTKKAAARLRANKERFQTEQISMDDLTAARQALESVLPILEVGSTDRNYVLGALRTLKKIQTPGHPFLQAARDRNKALAAKYGVSARDVPVF